MLKFVIRKMRVAQSVRALGSGSGGGGSSLAGDDKKF